MLSIETGITQLLLVILTFIWAHFYRTLDPLGVEKIPGAAYIGRGYTDSKLEISNSKLET
jgi:hypothetical protein